MAKCKPFLQIISSELEYGLHFAAVLSRRDPRFAGGALEVQQIPKLAYGLHRAKVATGELASAKADVRRYKVRNFMKIFLNGEAVKG